MDKTGGPAKSPASGGEPCSDDAKAKIQSAITTGQSLQACIRHILQRSFQDSSATKDLKEQLAKMQGQLLKALQQLQSTELHSQSGAITMSEGKMHLVDFCKVMGAQRN